MVMGAHTALVVRHPTRSLILPIIYINLGFLDGFIFLFLAVSLLSYSSGGGGGGGGIIAAAAAAGGGDSSLQALLNFKSSLKNAEDALSNWDPSSKTNPCSSSAAGGSGESWTGVLCFSGNVWGLQLENMGLGGDINIDSLLPLPQLRTLSFMHNKFEGPLPEFRKLGALKSLFLSDNLFSGDIPDDAFMGMSYLKKVHMANNNFTGYVPTSLAKSPRLLELKLENNQFVGPIPDFPPDLKFINVSNNQLDGPIPPLLSDMDATSFSGNKKLCGKPLKSVCETSPSPSVSSGGPQPAGEAKRDDEERSTMRMVVMVIAGLVGLAAMAVILIACSSRRKSKLGSGGATRSSSSSSSSSTSQRGKSNNSGNMSGGGGGGNGNVAVRSSNRDHHGRLTFVREDRQRFELQDLLRASAEVLGSGSFGSSYKAVLMDPEGQSVVVKRFKQMNKVVRDDFQEHMARLGRLSHPNLLPIVAYYYRKEEKLLVFDYIPNSSLATHLHGNHRPPLDWPTRLKIIKGVAKGLDYLHTHLPTLNVPHGHLKSSNVLLGKSFDPFLMDYALVPVVNPEQAQKLMVAYKSPEYCQYSITTKKTDVWSLGILILETLTGKFPSNYLPTNTSTSSTPMPGTTGSATANHQYLSKSGTSSTTTSSSSSSKWVNSIIPNYESSMPNQLEKEKQLGEAFDKEMGGSMNNAHEQMLKLLRIGIACCEDDLEIRLDLKEAVDKIDLINERDHLVL